MEYIERELTNGFKLKVPIDETLVKNMNASENTISAKLSDIFVTLIPTEDEKRKIKNVKTSIDAETATDAMIQKFVNLFGNIYPDTERTIRPLREDIATAYLGFMSTYPDDMTADMQYAWELNVRCMCLGRLRDAWFKNLKDAAELIPELKAKLVQTCTNGEIKEADCSTYNMIRLYDEWHNETPASTQTLQNIFASLGLNTASREP